MFLESAESVFPQHPNHPALNLHIRSRHHDRLHLRIRGLQANLVAFTIKTFECRIRAANQSDHNVPVVRDFVFSTNT